MSVHACKCAHVCARVREFSLERLSILFRITLSLYNGHVCAQVCASVIREIKHPFLG